MILVTSENDLDQKFFIANSVKTFQSDIIPDHVKTVLPTPGELNLHWQAQPENGKRT